MTEPVALAFIATGEIEVTHAQDKTEETEEKE